MKNRLPIIKQNNQLMLKKSKSLLTITNSILSNDNWMQRLWDWADKNGISDLEWIEYETMSEGYWKGLPREKDKLLDLERLRLGGYQISNLPNEISHLSKLVSISIVACPLKEFPKQLYDLKKLSIINIHKCNFEIIPDVVFKLHTLNKLTFRDTNIKIIPIGIGNLNNLESLNLGNNKIVNIPKDLCLLDKLFELNLENNNITDVPKDIKNLTELWNLELSENKLTFLPKEIGSLANLGVLDISKNELSSLPSDIGALGDLYSLSLNNNNLITLPDEITNIKNLEFLNLDENPNLVINKTQKDWILYLKNKGCLIDINDNLVDLNSIVISKYQTKFNELVNEIHGKDFDLARCFTRNITFETFQDNKLTLSSIASGEDKKVLIEHWELINIFVKEIFGFETKIINIAHKQELS